VFFSCSHWLVSGMPCCCASTIYSD
jgi:hypothetical protein